MGLEEIEVSTRSIVRRCRGQRAEWREVIVNLDRRTEAWKTGRWYGAVGKGDGGWGTTAYGTTAVSEMVNERGS